MAQKHNRSNREVRKPKKTAVTRSAEPASAPITKAAYVAVAINKKR